MSDQAATLQLILELKTKTDELRRGQQDVRAFMQSATDASKAIGSIGAGFTQGLGIGGALGVLGSVRSSITAIVGEMKAMVLEGVSFNKTLESAQIGIAGSLRNFFPERYKNFNEAMKGSAQVVDELKKKSAEFGISFESLADSYRANLGALLKGGVFDLQKQIDLTVLLSRTMQTFGITGARATRDVIDILNGTANRTVIAKELGIKDSDIKIAKESGQLYEFLSAKLNGYSEANKVAAESTAALEQRLGATKAQVAADATKELTSSYRELLKALTEFVNSDSFKGMLNFLAAISTDAVNKARALVGAFTYTDPNKSWGKNARDIGTDVDGARAPGDLTFARRRALVQRNAAVGALQDEQAKYDGAFYKNKDGSETAAGAKLFAPYREAIAELDALIARIDQKGQSIIGENKVTDAKSTQEIDDMQARQRREEAASFLSQNVTKAEKLRVQSELMDKTDEQRLETLKKIITEKETESGAAADAAKSSEEAEVVDFKAAKEILPLIREREVLEKKIATAKNQAAKEADREALHTITDRNKNTLDKLEEQKGLVENDRFKTRLQKQGELVAILKAESTAIDDTVAALKRREQVTEDAAAKRSIESEITGLRGRQSKLPGQIEKNQPLNFSGEMGAQMTILQDQLGTFSQNAAMAISGSIGGAVSSVSSGISQWILRAQTFGQMMKNIGKEIVSSLVTSLVDAFVRGLSRMLIEYVTTKNGMFLVDMLFAAKGMVLSAANAAKSLIMWLPSAIAASISSWGTAAAIGAAAVIAIVAANKFDAGGFTPGGPKDKPAGIVHAGEWVAPQWMVNDPKYAGMIGSLEAARTGSGKGYLSGGMVNFLGHLPQPRWTQLKFVNDFQDKYNLWNGTALYGKPTPGGDVVRPSADQIGQARLASMGLTTAHSDYLASMSPSGGGSSSSSGGGGGGGGAANAQPVNVSVYAFVDQSELMRAWRRDPENNKHIVNVVRNDV